MKTDPDRLQHIGWISRELGVRLDLDMSVNFRRVVAPMTGGMSITADNPMKLSPQRRPASYGGIGCDPVFEILGYPLSGSLSLRQDGPPSNGLVE